MCYEFDEFFNRARLAELLRREKGNADALKKPSKTTAPAEPEVPVKEKEPIPA